jgi:hypothetical protein
MARIGARAKDILIIADRVADAAAKSELLGLADKYKQLAGRAGGRAAASPLSRKISR